MTDEKPTAVPKTLITVADFKRGYTMHTVDLPAREAKGAMRTGSAIIEGEREPSGPIAPRMASIQLSGDRTAMAIYEEWERISASTTRCRTTQNEDSDALIKRAVLSFVFAALSELRRIGVRVPDDVQFVPHRRAYTPRFLLVWPGERHAWGAGFSGVLRLLEETPSGIGPEGLWQRLPKSRSYWFLP